MAVELNVDHTAQPNNLNRLCMLGHNPAHVLFLTLLEVTHRKT